MSAWFARSFDALTIPQFRILWFGTLFAFLSFMMSWTVQSVVAFDLEGTNKAVGLVALGSGVSMLIVGPFGGVLADRFSKRLLLLLGQSMVGLSFLVLGVLVVTGGITLLWLVLATFVMGIAFSFTGPTRQAYVGDLVPREKLVNAVALSQLPLTIGRVTGPFAAGALLSVGFIGSGGTYLVMAAMFLIVLATLAQLPPSRGR